MKLRVSLVVLGLLAAVAAMQLQARAVEQPVQGPALLGKGFEEVSGWITKAADLVPADKYGYRPVGTVRTFGQQVAHIADAYAYYCGRAKTGQNVEWSDAVEKAGGAKAAIVAKLKSATDACTIAYAGANEKSAGPLMANIAHSNLHYGNIVTYMRMLGLTPPSS